MDRDASITKYLERIGSYFKDSTSSEMSYRTDFQNFLETIFPREDKYHIQHDPRAESGNKPDYIVLKNEVPILFIEVKKVGEDLDKIEKSSQASRYFGYTNLIISDYLSFRFYRNGQRYDEQISLGTPDLKNKEIVFNFENGERLVRTIIDFALLNKEPIKSGKHLAKIMGGKAQRIRDNTIAFLNSSTAENGELKKIMNVIKEHLVADIDIPKFADMYAQTLVYGLFVARYNDKTPDTFTRQEARDLVPATNPFLQHFFDHIAGNNFPKRLDNIVSELCEVFTHADVHKLLTDYYVKEGQKETKDPIIHFYEDFLFEYDPAKKMEMGVFYTPLPVVRFIVRSVDQILKKEFGIDKGLVDNQIIIKEQKGVNEKGKEVKTKHEYHKVQILDVATGTGTFLNEVIKYIHESFSNHEGAWPAYVESDLIPRLHGFELMMASYTIAHLKLGMTLQNTGVEQIKKRLGVYLTNTLDEASDYSNQGTLFGFMDSIAEESKSASRIKKEYPIMVVIGNPPYSSISQNKHYEENNAYKIEPGGLKKLQERKNWLDDDYVKFIRFAESLIEKNGEGIIGMITAHGYIDNPTFRGMRWHLRKTFDMIYVIDLHGNNRKKEVGLDGSKDENIFDIMSGVSIILGVKKSKESKDKKLATIYLHDMYGTRADKFKTLDASSIENINWIKLPEDCEIWKIEGEGKEDYLSGFNVNEIFTESTTGIFTLGDSFIIDKDKNSLTKKIEDFLEEDISEIDLKSKFDLGKNYAKWIIENKKKGIDFEGNKIIPITYRPFDTRYTYFDNKLVWRPRTKLMSNFLNGDNPGLAVGRQGQVVGPMSWNIVFITKYVIDLNCFYRGGEQVYPLYVYTGDGEKTPNINKAIWQKINEHVGSTTPENILDYIYAYLHSPAYREKYKEFLKVDFPHIEYQKDKEKFWKLVPLGNKLRELHLLNDPVVKNSITTYPVSGLNEVDKITYKDGNVYLNETQYFGNVPETAWGFYIGGYQPAQKYLKDRKGKVLTHSEIENYEQMIVALTETSKVMAQIDEILI